MIAAFLYSFYDIKVNKNQIVRIIQLLSLNQSNDQHLFSTLGTLNDQQTIANP